MSIKPVWIAILTFTVIFGGIGVASLAGLWNTSGGNGGGNGNGDGKGGAIITAGNYAPEDIRGSFTFDTVSQAFGFDPAVLLQAFGLPEETDPASVRSGKLGGFFADSGYDIGNGSVRMFVALYCHLEMPAEQDVYLPASAAEMILQVRTDLSAQELAYLESHIVDVTPDLTALP